MTCKLLLPIAAIPGREECYYIKMMDWMNALHEIGFGTEKVSARLRTQRPIGVWEAWAFKDDRPSDMRWKNRTGLSDEVMSLHQGKKPWVQVGREWKVGEEMGSCEVGSVQRQK